ncbi:MAG: ABC-type transport auxiliary lipoprotein family protein [Povalibacter sp.]
MTTRRLAMERGQMAGTTQHMHSSRTAARITMLVMTLALSACSGSFFESDLPVPTRYVIAPPAAAESAISSHASQVDLAIGRPDVAPGLDSDRIAVLRGHELDFYRGALWSGTVLDTVQTFLVSALQDQKRFRSVAPEQARITGDYILDVEVRDFQAEYASAAALPVAHVTLVCRLIRISDRRMVDTLSVTGSQPASENRLATVAGAFETVMQQLSLELATRTADLISRDREQNPPRS